jgi:hypothetical protein
MSYCRFRNTTLDLRDCLEALRHGEVPEKKRDREEFEAMQELIALCVKMADEFDGVDLETLALESEED